MSWSFCVAAGCYLRWSINHDWRLGLAAAVGMIVLLALVPTLFCKPQVRTLELSPAGLHTVVENKSKTLSWRDIAKFECENEYLIITGHSGNAFMVPPFAFRPDQTLGDVRAAATAWRRAAISIAAV